MPPIGFYNAYGINIYFCDKCKDEIEYALRDTVYLPFQMKTCNSYTNYNKQQRSFCATSDMLVNIGHLQIGREEHWKFSNDSRRAFLKFLRTGG